MLRTILVTLIAAGLLSGAASARRVEEISGIYLETRTCQVYTGPCFANAESAIAGKDAVMAWNIEEGKHRGVDLTGLSVVVCMTGDATLGFNDGAALDDGAMWPTSYALMTLGPEEEARIAELVKRAAG